MSLQAEIWAWKLGGGGRGAEEEKEEKEEKIPHMCESIGHRPLRSRCPKREHLNFVEEMTRCRIYECTGYAGLLTLFNMLAMFTMSILHLQRK